MRLKGALNGLRKHPLRYLLGSGFLALLFWGILWATRWGVGFIDGYPAVGAIADAVMQRSLEGLFAILALGVAFSVLTTAVSTLYSSEDLPFLLSLPAKSVNVFYLKVFETYLSAALLPTIFTLPVLVGLGLERSAPPHYYLIALASLLSLYAIPVALGSLLALLLMRVAPAGRVKEVATAASVFFAAALIFGLRALRPEQLAAMSPEEFTALLRNFARLEVGWLPTGWTSDAVWGALSGRVTPGALLLAAVSLVLLLMVAWAAAFAYREGWIRALDAAPPRLDPAPRPPPLWERLLHRFGPGGGLVAKDNRLLLRDPTQWSQLLVLVALAGVYLVSVNAFDVDLQRFKDAVGTMNLAFLSFVLAGIGIRMTYPLVSLEAEGFWLLKTGPLSSWQIVRYKFYNALPLMLLLGFGLGLATALLIDVSPTLAVAAPVAGLCSGLVVTGLGVGLGAAYPRFDATNPAEIPVSPGGLLYMTLSLLFAVLMTALLAYPAWRALQNPEALFWLEPAGLLLLSLILLVSALATLLPLWYGSYRLSRYEPGN